MNIRIVAVATAAFLAGIAAALELAPAFSPTPSTANDLSVIRITPADRHALEQARATDRWLDDEILFREGLRRGFAWDDLIVRRELQRRVRMALLEAAPAPAFDDAALSTYLAAHADRYQAPTRRSFEQVYFGRAAHSAHLESDAQAAGVRLQSRPDDFAALGDAVPGGATRTAVTDADVEADFGAAFTRAIRTTPLGVWTGPVASTLGLHWVRVTGVEEARPLALDAARTRVRADLETEHQLQAVRSGLDALRTGYRVVDDTTAVRPTMASTEEPGE